MARVPMTLNDLKAAMRDDRYWKSLHPEYEGYRRWVMQGWQEYGAAGGLEDEAGTMVVQVSGYQRTRNGRREQVQPYEQRRQVGQDEANDNARPAGTPAASPQELVAPAAAEREVLVIFVGGAGDRWGARLVTNYVQATRAELAQSITHRVAHFDWNQHDAIEGLIRAQPAGTAVRHVGHSWGGDTAAKVAGALGRDGIVLDMLVTVDPVGNNDADRPAAIAAARAGARRWINLRAVGGSWRDQSNLIAAIGGRWAEDARGVADEFIAAPTNHAGFRDMMSSRTPSGRRVIDEVLGTPSTRR